MRPVHSWLMSAVSPGKSGSLPSLGIPDKDAAGVTDIPFQFPTTLIASTEGSTASGNSSAASKPTVTNVNGNLSKNSNQGAVVLYEIRQSQEKQESWLRSFVHQFLSQQKTVQEELQDLKSSLVKEVQTSKEELLEINREELSAINSCLETIHNPKPGSRKMATPCGSEIQHDAKPGVGNFSPSIDCETVYDAQPSSKPMPSLDSGSDNAKPGMGNGVSVASDLGGHSKEVHTASHVLGAKKKESHLGEMSKYQWEHLWADFQTAITEVDKNNAMLKALKNRTTESTSIWHDVEHWLGIRCLRRSLPDNCLARFTQTITFVCIQNILILSNTTLMGYEADCKIKISLGERSGELPTWITILNQVFEYLFVVEILFRIAAKRSWFFVAPADWGWNLFDIVIISASLVTELSDGESLSYLRTLRILRAARAVRIIRVLRFFRELRKMLFGILACMRSLIWCFVFLAITMFMFSILFLQGIVHALDDMDPGSAEYQREVQLTKQWYPSLLKSMFSILCAVTGGIDWLTVREPLLPAGYLYINAFLIYVLFVTVGVMNVLTGVFLASADEYVDRSMIVQNEQLRVDSFVSQMLEIFEEMDIHHTGSIDWPRFDEALKDDTVQAYLAAHQLEPTHARIIFDLLDDQEDGKINIVDWVIGMVRLKGEAKAVDARIIQRETGMLAKMFFQLSDARDDNVANAASP